MIHFMIGTQVELCTLASLASSLKSSILKNILYSTVQYSWKDFTSQACFREYFLTRKNVHKACSPIKFDIHDTFV